MKTMIDIEGNVWCVGDLVLQGSRQGIIKSIESHRTVLVRFPGATERTFVSGLVKVGVK